MAKKQHHDPVPQADPAFALAQAVVGLYGDPSVTWSVLLEYQLGRTVSLAHLVASAAALVAEHPHLGRRPEVQVYADADVGRTRDALANTPFDGEGPLLRVALAESGDTILLAAHHGVMDGLGMVGFLNRLLGVSVASRAHGVADRPSGHGFARAAAERLWEAATRPPARFRRSLHADPLATGDWLVSRDVVGPHLGSASLLLAAREAWQLHNGEVPGRRPVMVAVGASRRGPGDLHAPDRRTAYLRVDATSLHSLDGARAALRGAAPEPDFPASRAAGIGPLVTRLLRGRLGSTVLVSNLGVLSGDRLVREAAFWPAASGPSGIALGLVSVGPASTLSLRARRADFDHGTALRLLELVAGRLAAGRDGLTPGRTGDQ